MLAQRLRTQMTTRTTLSSIACVWSDLGEDEEVGKWYEDTHLPDVVAQLGTDARLAEQAQENMFKEVSGIDGAYMAVHDLPDGKDTEDLEMRLRPALEKLPGDVKIDARVYTQFAQWHGEDWREDEQDIQMWIVVLWQPVEAVHDQFVEWFTDEFAPGMLMSPELLRLRIFKLDNAIQLRDQTYSEQDTSSMFQYMTLWEFDCEELPWEILVYLGSSERWRYYVEGGHLNWQICQYMVNRFYPEDENPDSPMPKRASIMINDRRKPTWDDDDDDNEPHILGSDSDETEQGSETGRGTDSTTDVDAYVLR